MKRLADYVFDYLTSKGVDHVFMVTGGGAMFLNDAIGLNKGIKYVCCHHEQACAMAAEGYSRISGKVGVVNVTTGPGTINALNGVFGAYTDSIPMLVVSGQNKRETILPTYNIPGLRQLGEQEADIISMVKGITKYAVLVNDPLTIRYHLERALHLATAGRPGPTWIDIPVDVSNIMIDPPALRGYDPREDSAEMPQEELAAAVSDAIARLGSAQRPVVMAGSGVRLAGAADLFDSVTRRLGIPVTTAWTAHDLVASDEPLFCGRPGSIGDRPGNFTVQNSDLLLVLGSRLNIRQVSYNWKDFARHAFKIQVDADLAELIKPLVKSDLPIQCDLRAFLGEMDRQLAASGFDTARHAAWLSWCRERMARFPNVTAAMREPKGKINPYVFLDALMRKLGSDDVVACGNGSACVVTFQVAQIKKGLRLFCNSGSASMGYDIPAAIGAALAAKGRVICLAGDGSCMFNLQELQTLVHHRLPIKIFILNNEGYLSMRTTQKNFFKGNYVGEGPRSGVTFPDFVKVGEAFGIPSMRIERLDFNAQLDGFLNSNGPALAEVILDPEQAFEPKLAARQMPDGKIVSPSLEDMSPFLSREELKENMLVPLIH
jgi:acetolactate synthase I/II/III large subunit